MPVQTRNMIKQALLLDTFTKAMTTMHAPEPEKRGYYEVDIDFDEAARKWRKNKIARKNGMFVYRKETRNSHRFLKIE